MKLGFIGAALGLVVLASSTTGCITDRHNMISGARLGNYLDFRTLRRKDYVVLAGVKGKAQVRYTRWVVIPRYSVGVFVRNTKSGYIGGESELKDGFGIFEYPGSFSPASVQGLAKNEAVYNALAKIPDADLLLQPRFTWRCVNKQFFVFASEVCTVEVRGKAIRIKAG